MDMLIGRILHRVLIRGLSNVIYRLIFPRRISFLGIVLRIIVVGLLVAIYWGNIY